MKEKSHRDPEFEAPWAVLGLEAWTRKRIAEGFERIRAAEARDERRRARLRRLTFGLLGR